MNTKDNKLLFNVNIDNKALQAAFKANSGLTTAVFGVVEKIGKGIHSHAKQIAWFCWDEERKGFYEREKPEWAEGWYNFALG